MDWVYSDDLEPGEGPFLLEAMKRIEPPKDKLIYAWGGGEMN